MAPTCAGNGCALLVAIAAGLWLITELIEIFNDGGKAHPFLSGVGNYALVFAILIAGARIFFRPSTKQGTIAWIYSLLLCVFAALLCAGILMIFTVFSG